VRGGGGWRRHLAVVAQLGEDAVVVGRVDDDAHVGVVLGRGPHHRRTADVDQLDAGLRRERVEVHDHEVDGSMPYSAMSARCSGSVGVGEHAAVDLRVQRDDPVVEDRRARR
jgi:hypothetical protein